MSGLVTGFRAFLKHVALDAAPVSDLAGYGSPRLGPDMDMAPVWLPVW